MITVRVNKENNKQETVTYSTLVALLDGKLVTLSVTRYLGYAKPYELDHELPLPKEVKSLFEEFFYWPEECYTNPKLNHFMYHRMMNSDFNKKSNEFYKVGWKEEDF